MPLPRCCQPQWHRSLHKFFFQILVVKLPDVVFEHVRRVAVLMICLHERSSMTVEKDSPLFLNTGLAEFALVKCNGLNFSSKRHAKLYCVHRTDNLSNPRFYY